MKLGFIANTIADTARSAQNRTTSSIASSVARLASGNRIVAASDDTASLSIATKLRAQLSSLRSAYSNINQADSMLQIADQSLGQMTNILQRQKEIATRASSGDISDRERGFLAIEFTELSHELDRIASSTNFNGVRFFSADQHNNLQLATTNAQAAASIRTTASLQVGGGGNAIASVTAVQAFNELTGATMAGVGAAGRLQFVDGNGAVLTDAGYATLNESVYGKFSSFTLTDVTYGPAGRGSATLTATLNGVEYSARILAGNNLRVTLTDGRTNINMHVGNVNLTSPAAANFTAANIGDLFKDTIIARTNSLSGANFFGTALQGATGAANGMVNLRLTGDPNVTISNFEYASNNNTANSNRISVKVNGTIFVADNVRDLISGGILQFRSESRIEVLSIDLAGLDANITNIRTRALDRQRFIDALNQGFATVKSGLSFSVGDGRDQTINVKLANASVKSLFDGQQVSVYTANEAGFAAAQLDHALKRVVSMRADIGAGTSRLEFAGAAVSSAIQNQEAARSALADTDIASESTAFASATVKNEFATYAIVQANNLPEDLLDLLSG